MLWGKAGLSGNQTADVPREGQYSCYCFTECKGFPFFRKSTFPCGSSFLLPLGDKGNAESLTSTLKPSEASIIIWYNKADNSKYEESVGL